MKNKIIAVLTLSTLLISCVLGGTASVYADIPPREYIIADFGNSTIPDGIKVSDQIESNCTTMALTDDVAYGSKESSLAWTIGTTTGLIRIPYTSQWDTDFDTFNIRIHTQTANQKINFLINELNTFLRLNDKGYYSAIKKNFPGGWTIISIPISEIKNIFETQQPQYVYIRLNCNGWEITSGTEDEFLNQSVKDGKTVTSIAGEMLCVDSIWLSNSSYGAKTLSPPTPSIANGKIGVEPDIDGNLTYTLTFSENVYEIKESVSVFHKIGEIDIEKERDVDYSVVIEGNVIKLIFKEELLLPSTCVVTIDDEAIISESAEMLAEDAAFSFTVGNVLDFKALSSTPVDESSEIKAGEPFEAMVTFNSTLPDEDLSEFVEITENGKSYTAFSTECDGSVLKISFNQPLIGLSEYRITVQTGFGDIYNNMLINPFTFVFATAKKPVYSGSGSVIDDSDSESIKLIYSSNIDEDLQNAIKNSGNSLRKASEEPTGFYTITARTDYGTDKVYSAWCIRNQDFDTTGMKYVNYWVYQDKPSSKPFNLPLYYNDVSRNANTQIDANWSGWKLISIPIPGASVIYDSFVVNVNGWNLTREESGFFCVDDIWLSKEMPSGIELLSSGIKDGSADVDIYDVTTEFKFTAKINSKLSPVITLTTETGEAVTDITTNVAGDTISVDLDGVLPDNKYNLSICNVYSVYGEKCEDVSIGFSTVKKALTGSQREKLVELSNGNDVDELYDFIKEHSDFFYLENESDDLLKDISRLVINCGDFEIYNDVKDEISNIFTTFGLFNENHELWAKVCELIEENSRFFGGSDDADYKYFTSLKGSNKNKICTEICREFPVDSVTELNILFEEALDGYKASQKESSKGSSGSGSGSGRTTASTIVDPSLIPVNNEKPVDKANIFVDLDGFEWAYDSIMSLYETGVISVSSNKCFRPGDNITREEFVKMLVCAFKSDAPTDYHKFNDEEDDAWYASYLTKAYNSGISLGYPDGRFGIGECITREDMVTMACRAKGIEAGTPVNSNFTDANRISDYALGYVDILSQMGIVSGMGDGSFAPKSNATRAQAAKVISQLIKA